MSFTMNAVAHVRAARRTPEDDFWGNSESVIELVDGFDEDSLAGIESFSHAEILYLFHQVAADKIVTGARHPRNNLDWPKVGIFAQRGKNRPNRIGSTIVRLVRREGRRLIVAELDAIDGTPVLDIKPVLRAFLPRGEVREPAWAEDLMRDYWSAEEKG
jgi:tRNA-Thr(GGU) m(6)t(6)A37 methyltransferase TsaA